MSNTFRSRSGSISKRTRDSPEEEKAIFTPSKKILRSPSYSSKQKETPPNMDELMNMIKEMREDSKRNDNMMKEMMAELKRNTEEVRSLRVEMNKKEEEWKAERKELVERINILEKKIDNQDKEKRRNNTVISGIEVKGENLEQYLERVIAEVILVDAKIKKAYKINNKNNIPMYMVEWVSWEDKRKVMQNKYKLKDKVKNVYIENDLTWEERKIQFDIRAIAKTERAKNKKVKVGYQKIFIEGKEYKWCTNEGGLVEVDDPIRWPKN